MATAKQLESALAAAKALVEAARQLRELTRETRAKAKAEVMRARARRIIVKVLAKKT
jgi:hypothetical protein